MSDQYPTPGMAADPAPMATRVETTDDLQVEGGAASSQSVGQLLGHTMEEISTLFRQEVELAKAELRVEVGKARDEVGKAQAEAKKAGKAAGKLGAAGVVGHLALLLITFAAAWALAEVIPAGFAFLVVAIVVGVIALVLYSAGRKQLRNVSFDNIDFSRIDPKPDQAIAELKETKQWAKHQ